MNKKDDLSVCAVCGKEFALEDNYGTWRCHQHFGKLNVMTNKWSCCGKFEEPALAGCVACDHSLTGEPWDEESKVLLTPEIMEKLGVQRIATASIAQRNDLEAEYSVRRYSKTDKQRVVLEAKKRIAKDKADVLKAHYSV